MEIFLQETIKNYLEKKQKRKLQLISKLKKNTYEKDCFFNRNQS